jgi:23S rRNA (cytosine1962-C5)-methyltransferase
MAEIILKQGREKSLLRHHPWIFSGAIQRAVGVKTPGETVNVFSHKGEILAKAAYNPRSQISARVWSWDPETTVDGAFFEHKLSQAIEVRNDQRDFINSDSRRLVHGESDGIPGLIIDQYGAVVVVQFLSAGVEFWREDLSEIIPRLTHCAVLFERSDADVRKLEGLEDHKGILYGTDFENPLVIEENGIRFFVDIEAGHKTGFYLDQRDNRELARKVSSGRKILDCFSYSGGFAVNTLVGGANSVTLVDSSESALRLARENISLNQLEVDRCEFIESDVFSYLRTLRDKNETFDLIILDPPKFAPTAAQADRASRAYKDINLLAFKLLNNGGLLLTFSCSGGVNEDLFQKIVAGAASDCGAEAIILQRLHQALDHPVALNFPEGAYLKGFLIKKIA